MTSTLTRRSKRYINNRIYWIAPALFGVLVAVFYAVQDYWLDDYEFSRFLGMTAEGTMNLPDFLTLKHLVAERWRFDSFRLCNFAIVPMLLLPRWATAALMGAGWFGFMMILLRLTGLTGHRAPWVVAGLMAMVPAWWAYLPTLSSNMNYVSSLLLGAMVVLIVLRRRKLNAACSLALGLLAGWWHEGLSAPLIAAVGALVVLKRDFRCRQNFLLLAGLIVGFVILDVNPGFLFRMRLAHGAETMYSGGAVAVVNLAINCVLPAFFVGITLICVPRLLRTPLWITFAALIIVSLALEAVSGIVRSSFVSQYFSCVAATWVAAEASYGRLKVEKTFLAVAAGAMMTTTFVAAISDGVKVNRFNRSFIDAVLRHPGEVVYADAVIPCEASPLSLGKAPAMIYQLPALHFVYPIAYEDIMTTKVIPRQYEDFVPEENGWDASPSGAWHRGYAFVLPYDGNVEDRWKRVEAEADIPGLGKVRMIVNVLPFRGTDGHTYRAVVHNEQPPYLPAPSDLRITMEHGIFSLW